MHVKTTEMGSIVNCAYHITFPRMGRRICVAKANVTVPLHAQGMVIASMTAALVNATMVGMDKIANSVME